MITYSERTAGCKRPQFYLEGKFLSISCDIPCKNNPYKNVELKMSKVNIFASL